MAKNFDEQRAERAALDRDFIIGGEHFRARPGVRPEKLSRYDDLDADSTVEETLAIVDELILAMIEEDDNAHERYRALRLRDDDPVTVEDLQELVKWLMEAQTGRPTGQPGDSSAGPERTGTISTVASS
jgi:hypothetical protein